MHADGHEIGCHGYEHVYVVNTGRACSSAESRWSSPTIARRRGSVETCLTQQHRRWYWVRQGLALCLVAGLLLVIFLTPIGAQLRALLLDSNPQRLQLWLAGTDAVWVPLVLIVLMLLHTLVPVPAELLALVAGMLLGPWWGVCTMWVGAMGGAYLGFFLARAFGRDLVERFAEHHRLQRFQNWIPANDILVLLGIRLLPVLSFNLINYALGLTRIGWWRFTWTTALGILPMTVVSVVFGAHLHSWKVLLLLTLVAFGVCSAGFLVVRRRSPVSLT